MNALAPIAAVRPSRYVHATYDAFRVVDGRTLPIELTLKPSTLATAIAVAQCQCAHKDRLAIRETDERGARLHLFAIRKGTAIWAGRGLEARRLEPMRAEPLCIVDLGVVS